MKWELIEDVLDGGLTITDRLRVPQGWLLRMVMRGDLGQQFCCSQILIEDKNHTWALEAEDNWKKIDESRPDDFIITEYLLVPGGWVVRTFTSSNGDDEKDGQDALCLTFISDPEHTWIKQNS